MQATYGITASCLAATPRTKAIAAIRNIARTAAKMGTKTGLRLALATALLFSPTIVSAQATHIRDITTIEGATPVRIVGYGIVVGLDGTGDRGLNSRSGDQTVQSIANLLRRFAIEIPAAALRTRNAAAVLVTAEISPYLRNGGRFDVTVSSLGDARSLRGGTLWMTPLVTDAGAQALATAQGSILMSDGKAASRDSYPIETSGKIPSGGILEVDLPKTNFASTSRLLLKEPNITTATKIADAINQAIGDSTAVVEDPGAIALTLPATASRTATLVKIQELTITPDRPNRIIIDSRDGSVAAGGDITVSAATVSHAGITLTIGATTDGKPETKAEGSSVPGSNSAPKSEAQAVHLQPGVSAQKIAAALHAIQLEPQEIAAIFEALRGVGALSAEIIIK